MRRPGNVAPNVIIHRKKIASSPRLDGRKAFSDMQIQLELKYAFFSTAVQRPSVLAHGEPRRPQALAWVMVAATGPSQTAHLEPLRVRLQ